MVQLGSTIDLVKFGLTLRERFDMLCERLILCYVLRRHVVKFSSAGRCIHCGRKVNR